MYDGRKHSGKLCLRDSDFIRTCGAGTLCWFLFYLIFFPISKVSPGAKDTSEQIWLFFFIFKTFTVQLLIPDSVKDKASEGQKMMK